MNYINKKINDYSVHIIKTTKFKKTMIKFCFRSPIIEQKEEIKRDILCNLLVLGTEKYQTKRQLEIKCEDLFGASISMNNVKSGNHFIFSSIVSIINEKYTLENTLEEAISFIKEIIFNPKLVNGVFDEKLVQLAKNMYLEEIKSTPDNPGTYSIIKMRSFADKNSNYAFDSFFYLDEIEQITAQDLYKSYQNLLNNSEFDIVIVGDVDDKISDYFNELPVNYIKSKNDIYSPIKSNKNEIIEEGNYNQSKLAISYKLNDLTDFEKKYVMYVFSYILGGSSDSLIFKKLRQDNSLCYYANSSYLFFYQVLEIVAGIQSDNYEKAVSLIKEAIQEIINGNFDEEEIKKAQITYQSAWTEILDSPSSIANMYLSHTYYDLDLLDDRINNIKKVTKKDIIEVSKKLELNTTYLLKGINEND